MLSGWWVHNVKVGHCLGIGQIDRPFWLDFFVGFGDVSPTKSWLNHHSCSQKPRQFRWQGPEEKWLSRFGCNYPWSRDTSVAWYIKSCLTSIPNVRRGLAKSHYLPNIGFTSGLIWLDVFFENRVVMINPVSEHLNMKVWKLPCTVSQLTPILEPSTRLVKELNFQQEKTAKEPWLFFVWVLTFFFGFMIHSSY